MNMLLKKIKSTPKWIKSPAGITTIICIVMGIVSFLIANGINSNLSMNISSVFISLSASLFSIIATVTFVQFYLNKQQMFDVKKEENINIIKYNNYIQLLISWYTIAFNQLLTPTAEIKGMNNDKLKENFNVSDLCEANFNSMLLKNGFNESRIKVFFEIENKVNSAFAKMLEIITIEHNCKLYMLIIEFLTVSISYNSQDALETNYKYMYKGQDALSKTREWIQKDADDFYKNRFNTDNASNMLSAYCFLYELMIKEKRIINEYVEQIRTIEKDLLET